MTKRELLLMLSTTLAAAEPVDEATEGHEEWELIVKRLAGQLARHFRLDQKEFTQSCRWEMNQ